MCATIWSSFHGARVEIIGEIWRRCGVHAKQCKPGQRLRSISY
jgi:hypothetical protein